MMTVSGVWMNSAAGCAHSSRMMALNSMMTTPLKILQYLILIDGLYKLVGVIPGWDIREFFPYPPFSLFYIRQVQILLWNLLM